MDFDQIGPALALGLSCLGSAIGCGIAGMASHGVMARVEEGHGKFIGMSAAPSSQSIYGFILMLLMINSIQAGTLSALSGIGIGLSSGIAIMGSAIYQGKCAALQLICLKLRNQAVRKRHDRHPAAWSVTMVMP